MRNYVCQNFPFGMCRFAGSTWFTIPWKGKAISLSANSQEAAGLSYSRYNGLIDS